MSVKFVIVGAARTGSTLLVRTLNSLPNARCHGELLGPEQVRGYEDEFDPSQATPAERETRMTSLKRAREADPVGFIQDALTGPESARGFKALYSAILDPRWEAVTNALLAAGTVRFIHLRRENGLRRHISEMVLRAGGPNHSGAGGRSEERIKVHIDPAVFRLAEETIKAQGEAVAALLAGQSVMPLTYEELAANTSVAIARVCTFLDLPLGADSVRPALAKVGAANLRETVSNYDELYADASLRDLLSRQ